MLEPIFDFGTLWVTWFSVAVFCGAALGAALFILLVRKTGRSLDTALEILPLSLFLSVMLAHILYVVAKLISNLDSYENLAGFLLNPGCGGFMYLGAFAGAALSCLIVAACRHERAGDWFALLLPVLFLVLAVVRFAEPLDGMGKGPSVNAAFFPLSYAPEADYPEDQYVPAFFYAGVYALALCVWSARQAVAGSSRRRTPLFFFVLYLAGQMFFEIFRRDVFAYDISLITFIRLGQLYAVILLGVIMVYAVIRAKRAMKAGAIAARCAVFAVSVGACVGLQFLFDKPLPLFGQTIWFADWVVYALLFLCAVGMGWSVLSVMKRMPARAA